MASIQQQLSGAHTQLNERGTLISNLHETLEQTKVDNNIIITRTSYVLCTLQASHAEQLSAVQVDLSQCQFKCDELEGLKSSLELLLEQTQCQLNGELEEVNKHLKDTQQELTQTQVSVHTVSKR